MASRALAERDPLSAFARSVRAIWLALVIAFFSGCFFQLLTGGETGLLVKQSDSAIYLLIVAGIYGGLGTLIVFYAYPVVSRLGRHPFAFIFIVTSALSLLLSENISAILGMNVALQATVALALGAAVVFPPKQIVNVVALVLTAAAVCSAIYVIGGWPGALYLDPLERTTVLGTTALQGIFGHKNALGSAMGLLFVIVVNSQWQRARKISIGVLAAALCVLSNSVTSILAMAMAASATLLGRRVLRAGPTASVLAIFPLAVFGALIFLNYDEILSFFGRDAQLTGRTSAWSIWWDAFRARPLFGYGFGGFFFDSSNAPVRTVERTAGFSLVHFHNGYMEVLSYIGVVGGVVFARIIYVALQNAWRIPGGTYDVPPGLGALIFLMILALGENSLMYFQSMGTLLIFYYYFYENPLA
ncbi:MAG: O-antigen ligase family protein [Geminicoccaceae bacterium]